MDRRVHRALIGVGGVLVAAGVALLAWTAAHPVSFGWFGYEPLPASVVVAPATGWWGLGCIAAGLIVLAFVAGSLLGRRGR